MKVPTDKQTIDETQKGPQRSLILEPDGPTDTLPSLQRSLLLTERAAQVGFDWPSIPDVMAKLREEVDELAAAIEEGDEAGARAELGDTLFALANLARFLDADPEFELQRTIGRFVDRFRYIERQLSERGRTPAQSNLEEMDALWNEAKRSGVGVAQKDQ